MEDPEEMMTVAEAAVGLGLTQAAVRAALHRARLPFVRRYGRTLITRAALEAYRLRTQPEGVKRLGRPRKA